MVIWGFPFRRYSAFFIPSQLRWEEPEKKVAFPIFPHLRQIQRDASSEDLSGPDISPSQQVQRAGSTEGVSVPAESFPYASCAQVSASYTASPLVAAKLSGAASAGRPFLQKVPAQDRLQQPGTSMGFLFFSLYRYYRNFGLNLHSHMAILRGFQIDISGIFQHKIFLQRCFAFDFRNVCGYRTIRFSGCRFPGRLDVEPRK